MLVELRLALLIFLSGKESIWPHEATFLVFLSTLHVDSSIRKFLLFPSASTPAFPLRVAGFWLSSHLPWLPLQPLSGTCCEKLYNLIGAVEAIVTSPMLQNRLEKVFGWKRCKVFFRQPCLHIALSSLITTVMGQRWSGRVWYRSSFCRSNFSALGRVVVRLYTKPKCRRMTFLPHRTFLYHLYVLYIWLSPDCLI